MFAFHTATFMTGAIALYEQLGYRRAPRFDIDLGARFGGFGATSSMAIAYVRQLAPRSEQGRRVRCGQRPTGAASGPGEHR